MHAAGPGAGLGSPIVCGLVLGLGCVPRTRAPRGVWAGRGARFPGSLLCSQLNDPEVLGLCPAQGSLRGHIRPTSTLPLLPCCSPPGGPLQEAHRHPGFTHVGCCPVSTPSRPCKSALGLLPRVGFRVGGGRLWASRPGAHRAEPASPLPPEWLRFVGSWSGEGARKALRRSEGARPRAPWGPPPSGTQGRYSGRKGRQFWDRRLGEVDPGRGGSCDGELWGRTPWQPSFISGCTPSGRHPGARGRPVSASPVSSAHL